ncbi:MAG: acyltransferase [Prevotella sp.]|nr:acyltransferase [Prevotella sp.]
MTSPSAASPAASAPRLLWIDLLRGFLMLAIIFDHTEICFTGDNIVPYRMYVPDVLMAFFFLSGYLFYRPEGFCLRHKLHSWLRGVLMPYFIFTSALALPKAWLHGAGGSISDLLLTILTGQGSWFIASLAVAELLFCFLLWLSRARWRWLAGAGLFAVALAYGFGTRRLAFEANWWHVNEAVVALPSLLLGYMVHRFDSLGTRWRLGLFALLLVLSLPVNVLVASSSWPSVLVGALVLPRLFLVKNALSVLLLYLLFTISQRDGVRWVEQMPRWLAAMVSWTGRRSIVYYFFSSGIPTALTAVFSRLGYTYRGCYAEVLVVFLLNFLLITLVTWAIYRYLPWTTGRRKPNG